MKFPIPAQLIVVTSTICSILHADGKHGDRCHCDSIVIFATNTSLAKIFTKRNNYDVMDIADPSSMQHACHMNFIMDFAHRRVSSLAVCMAYELHNGPRSL
ncbi:unnamed protein product [Pocillopora meandrina]|uniref:Secreted protein n=1 Tax=Pocillopora meandrina TaxID=46732 RepID=A0AAU9W4B8_9CNID|nr:unnamed protein product [Pocillopora meandrina]